MGKTGIDIDHQVRSLFQRRRYQEAIACARLARRNNLEVGQGARDQLRQVIRTCRLLQNIQCAEEAGESISANLQAGWYSDRVRRLIAEGRLEKIARVPGPVDGAFELRGDSSVNITGFGNFFESGCAVVMRVLDANGPGWPEVETGSYTNADGMRKIPSTVLQGDYRNQWTDGRIFLKDSISACSCGHYDWDEKEGEVPRSTCEECQSYPLPMYAFPTWDVEPAAPVTSAEVPLIDVEYGVGLVSTVTHAALQSELDALGEKRQDSPAPKYHNIIDPNVGAVDNVWVPTEFVASRSPTVATVAVPERACERATRGSNLPQDFLAKAVEMHSPAFAYAEIQSTIPDLNPLENAKLYLAVQDVMQAALPLLARMRHPALLLPGPLQAVVKAQRIVLQEGRSTAARWAALERGRSRAVLLPCVADAERWRY